MLQDYYGAEYFLDERHRAEYVDEHGAPLRQDVSEYFMRFKEVESFAPRRGKILDVGASQGGMLNLFRQYGWVVEGIDISAAAVQQAWALYQLRLQQGTLEQFRPSGKMEVITMYQVLEHLPHPVQAVRQCFEMLQPGGILVIEVPNLKSIENRLSRHYRDLHYDLPRHLNHFTLPTLQRLLEEAGFGILSAETYASIYQVRFFGWLERLLGKTEKIVAHDAQFSLKSERPMEDIMAEHRKYQERKKHAVQTRLANFFPGWRITLIGKKPMT